MPQLILPVLVAAGLYAGAKWFMKQIAHQAEEAARVAEEMHRRASAATRVPKDLGTLEYDSTSQVYRPKTQSF